MISRLLVFLPSVEKNLIELLSAARRLLFLFLYLANYHGGGLSVVNQVVSLGLRFCM
jgi:hypothetical protein